MAYTVWLGGTNLDSGDEREVDPDTIPDAVSKYKVDAVHELLYLEIFECSRHHPRHKNVNLYDSFENATMYLDC